MGREIADKKELNSGEGPQQAARRRTKVRRLTPLCETLCAPRRALWRLALMGFRHLSVQVSNAANRWK